VGASMTSLRWALTLSRSDSNWSMSLWPITDLGHGELVVLHRFRRDRLTHGGTEPGRSPGAGGSRAPASMRRVIAHTKLTGDGQQQHRTTGSP
jgi:hypothetical protein